MSTMRIKEFLSKLKTMKHDVLTLSKSKMWVSFNTVINESSDVRATKEASENLSDLNNSLGINGQNELQLIKGLCDAEIKYLSGIHTVSTLLKTDIPAYNSAIKRVDSRHPALAFFKATKLLKESNNEYKQKVMSRSGERDFYDTEGFLNTAKELLKSNSYIAVSMGLAALTGRRPTEILLTATFEDSDTSTISFDGKEMEFDECLIFSGQLKTKDAENARDNYLIPVLCDSDLIIEGLARLRKLKDFRDLNEEIVNDSGKKMSPAQRVSSVAGSQQNKCVKKYFSKHFKDNVSPYDLRHAYALICTNKCNKNQIPKLLSNILGHSINDDSTMHSYMSLRMA